MSNSPDNLATRRLLAVGGTCLFALASITPVRADVFELVAGGEIRGTLVERQKDGAHIVKTDDGVQVTLAKNQIARVVTVGADMLEYERRSRTAADTPDGQRELAKWCKEHGLADEAQVHFERLLELAPDDEEARVGLDYQKIGGRWMTRDELMTRRGMIMFEGRYRTAQDVALRQRDSAIGTRDADWFGKIRLWRGWLDGRRAEQAAEARAAFAELDDPAAVPALLRVLADEKEDWAYLELLTVLGRFDSPGVTSALVNVSLRNARADERELALDLLTRDGRRPPLQPYVKALKDPSNKVVNRAGKAISEIGDPEAVSPLIDALVTEHKFIVQKSGGGITAGSVNGGAGFSSGGDGPKIVTESIPNREVLAALTKLTGQRDFEYDERAWRSWFVNEQARSLSSARRDE